MASLFCVERVCGCIAGDDRASSREEHAEPKALSGVLLAGCVWDGFVLGVIALGVEKLCERCESELYFCADEGCCDPLHDESVFDVCGVDLSQSKRLLPR